ncbi:substrate-binding domain-containing protein [Sulfurimonas sp. HSL-3221]|uniref:substrate-binding domain-containing protein n=1 Tax=Sulfurimonadaceae TaxID=2771471 RepID=UPI001E5D66A3|nr:substrate-binding domain-containing protein [Sulfurimonas sp. HSL-3221]UFS62584.1 substrate-binding domain-containing protein [Sulfurimonas sp. HSL-3221]
MRRLFLTVLFSAALLHAEPVPPLRVAVIGGMTMSGMWQQIAAAFEAARGIPVDVVVSGPKSELDAYCREHPVDLVTMHASDTITDLAADGLFEQLTPWTRNAQMLLGHRSDPAGLTGAGNLQEALAKLAASEAPFLVHASGGTFEVFNALRTKQGWRMPPEQLRFTPAKRGFLKETAALKGYTLYGVIPFLMHKQHHPQILGFYFDDPALRRPYLAAIGSQGRLSAARHARAEALLAFLTSPQAQGILKDFRIDGHPGYPVFYPLTPNQGDNDVSRTH